MDKQLLQELENKQKGMGLWLQGLLGWLLPEVKKCLAVPRNFFCKSY